MEKQIQDDLVLLLRIFQTVQFDIFLTIPINLSSFTQSYDIIIDSNDKL